MNHVLAAELDIDAILAARWADQQVFPPAVFSRAEEFWRQRRSHDDRLLAIRACAVELIREWTGHDSRDVGSFGLRLNLEASDLDLGIGYPVEWRAGLVRVLTPHTVFKGERVTRFPAADGSDKLASTRLVFPSRSTGLRLT